MTLTEDIINRIHEDFGENSAQAIKIVEKETTKSGDLQPDRIIRCIIFLAEGNIDDLSRYIEAAAVDPRDVMLWAEYEPSADGADDNKVRDFSEPF